MQPLEKSEAYQLMGINAKVSPYINGPEEFRDLINVNFAVPGALTKRPGTSLYVGATVAGRITGGIEFERLNGASYVVMTANTNAYTVSNSISAFKTGLLNAALFDFVTYVDRLFACNGQDFFKFDGSNSYNYNLPYGSSGWGVTSVVGGGLSGTYIASYGYINDRGFYGPVAPGITITLNGITFGTIQYLGMTTTGGFGATAIQLYRTSVAGVNMFGTTTATTGSTTASDTGFTLTTINAGTNIYFTLAPRYMEIYNNQLFMAGFSSIQSTVFWSEVAEPEQVEPEYFAEFRTNDGDRVTGLKAYAGSLIVSKKRSFHRLVGDDPSNFSIQEISDQYGCLSNRAMVVFENRLWFLDSKGVVEFDGANVRIVSNKVEPTFQLMNVDAAEDNAIAIHNRPYNEVWFIIPYNGASYNNRIVVYDYVADSWTHYDGLNISSLFMARGSQSIKTTFYGGYTGNLFYFGQSLLNDNGSAITCMIQSGFRAHEGQTSERMYRRYYLNVNPVLGVTQPITVNFYTNYGSSVQATRTMYQNPFQSRVDFGLSARSIQSQVYHVSASLPFQVTGHAFESRHQRSV